MSTIPSRGAKAGVSLASSLVVLMSALAGQRVFAQDAEDASAASQDEPVVVEEVIVQGMRQSLNTAQDIKRDADTFVDAISAQDIGALPDRSVLEALQRVPGVSIERFAASDDPDHFGTEGSGAVVRGMTQTRSEFNGRDSFTANSGRGLSFQDVPPELMQTVKVFKNQTADMIEGGIAGTVNLVTRKPFDSNDMQLAFSADATYGDMIEETTPTLSGLFSNRWDTDIGEFGFLLNATYSELEATSHGIQTDKFELRGLQDTLINYENDDEEDPSTFDDNVLIPGPDLENPYIYDGSFGRGVADRQPRTYRNGNQLFCLEPPGDDPDYPCTNVGALIPNGANVTMKDDVRTRKGLAAAFQWENPDDTLLFTSQFIRSDSELAWTENSLKNQSDYNSADQWYQPYDIEVNEEGEYIEDGYPQYVDHGYDGDGIFTHGMLTNIAAGWRGTGQRVPGNTANGVEHFGIRYTADTRQQTQRSLVEDMSFNLKWTPNDAWEVEGDFQYIEAETSNYDFQLMYGTFMNQYYDVRGGTPHLTIYDPWALALPEERQNVWGYNEDEEPNAPPEWFTDSIPYFSDYTSYVNYAAQDHIERSDGDSYALRLDVTHYFDEGVFTSVKAGVRRAERHQVVRNTTYNWGAIQPFWQNPVSYLDGMTDFVFDGERGVIPRSQTVDWSDFYRGEALSFAGAPPITIHPSDEIMDAYSSWGEIFADETRSDCGDWRPLDSRIDEEAFDENGDCANVVRSDLNGYFLDEEITDSREYNNAVYVRADFELDTAYRIAGNVGVRVVSIESESLGNTRFPDLRPGRRAPSDFNPDTFNPLDTALYPNPNTDLPYDLYDDSSEFLGDVNNFIPEEWSAFGNAASSQGYAAQRYTKTLPSFNMKVEISEDLLARFAISKAIALPDIGDMRNYTSISASQLQYSYYTLPVDPNPPQEDGNPIPRQQIVDRDTISLGNWVADAKNPFLKPMESNQVDLSLEWYFADAGSLTTSIFYKDLKNFFIQGAVNREFTNPTSGATEVVTVTGPMNGGDGEMKGFEINYQQFYDMLPEPFDGLGTQINYSNIQASGVPNTGVDYEGAEFIDDGTGNLYTQADEIGLEGQSEHTANFILMYQKYDIDARIAYNWRSEYLLTSYDVISRMPVYTDDAGYMDASIFYNITDSIKIGLQGTNLLNTQTKTFQLIDDEHKVGRSWFVNDRRYSLVLRASF